MTLLGVRSDVPDLLAAADVAVICSDREGQPLALIEYMAAGRAIVATRVGGIPEPSSTIASTPSSSHPATCTRSPRRSANCCRMPRCARSSGAMRATVNKRSSTST